MEITKALLLMGVGMGTVFAFLVLLSFVLSVSGRFVPSLAFMMPDPEPAKPKAAAPKSGDGASIALAIAAALRRRA
ncbi:MAG: OadG family protein [Kiritimatiellae bacterium]|nr:OadG family protein [Kiritimatiellia bacterium]MBR1836172.1 OadG family protein [Kiritimatiellia bacterium]